MCCFKLAVNVTFPLIDGGFHIAIHFVANACVLRPYYDLRVQYEGLSGPKCLKFRVFWKMNCLKGVILRQVPLTNGALIHLSERMLVTQLDFVYL